MRLHFAPFVALFGLVALSGCGKEQTETTTAATAPKTTAAAPNSNGQNGEAAKPAAQAISTEELDGVTSAKDPYKIVLIVKTRNNPFFKPMIAAFEEAATKSGRKGGSAGRFR